MYVHTADNKILSCSNPALLIFVKEINGLIKKVLTTCTRVQLTRFNGNICH